MFLEGTLKVEGRTCEYRIPSHLTKVDTISELKPLKQPSNLFFDCTEIHYDKQYITFHYEIEEGFLPLPRARKEASLQKLAIAENLLSFEALENSESVTFLYPENLYFKQLQEVKGLYRGIQGLMNPMDQNNFYHIQCLIVYLFTKQSFHLLKQKGIYSVYENVTDFLKHIVDARNFDDLRTAIVRERERLQESYMEELDKKKKGKNPQKRLLAIGASIVLALGISSASIAIGQSLASPSPSVQASQDVQSKLEQSNDLLDAYRLYTDRKYEQLIKVMKDDKQLTAEEKDLLKDAYLNTAQYDAAAKLSSEERVIQYLIKNKPDEFKNWESDSPLVKFEKAYFNQNYEEVLSLKEKIKPDKRQKKMIAFAYIYTDKTNEALTLAKEIDDKDLMIQVKNREIYNIKKDDKKQDDQKNKEIEAINKEIENLKKG